ncbi:juvenile hormone esterase-like [Culicoides brevitarsis]|uniref:juvenile hormone esterase-like n=1 Tax=Culicoides brevitarsis TaxID=469753 RepID=UPI00307BDD77
MTIVNLKCGAVRGSTLKTWKNTEFHAFRGIPYAKPPLGELRFKDPVPILPWKSVLDCTEEAPMCPQPRKSSKETSEDCLRLNVYTKNVSEKLPVLVYIHGGGLYVGSGASNDNGGPEYLMEKDIVLVTFNYRLGFLGFFNFGTPEYPGNAGFKDQVLALRWVKENISNFGGDSSKITLIGNSAGAMCVILHTISPMSRNLFHQAIVASGGINFQTEIARNQKDLIKKQAEILGIPHETDEKLIESFKNIPVERLVDTLYDNFAFGHDNPIFLWSYVIEDDHGQERFLIEDPRKSLVNGRFSKIPIIAGVTANELTTSAVDILKNPELKDEFSQKFDEIAPICFGYDRCDAEKSKIINETLKKSYKLEFPLTIEASLEPLSQLFSDAMIGFANHRVVNIFRRHQKVFRYKFSFVGRHSFLHFPGNKPYGAEHCDDFAYLFVNRRYFPFFTEKDPEAKIIECLTQFVRNFCHNGDPGMNWKPNTAEEDFFMNINETCELQQNLFAARYSVWEKLFPLVTFKEDE